LLAAAAIWLGAAGAFAQPAPAPTLTVKPVKPDIFMIVGAGGNSTVRVTDAGLVVVDGKNSGQPVYGALMAAIGQISPKPVRWLVDTHMHGDHTGNNEAFLAAGAKVAAQKNVLVDFARLRPEEVPAHPNVTYDRTYDIRLGGKTVRLLHFGPGHTDGDTLVYFPDLKAISMGDELTTTPFFDYAAGASIAGWIRSLDQALKLDWDTAIPGHGAKPLARADVVAFRDKLAAFLDRARAQVRAGTPKAQLIAAMKADDLWSLPPALWADPVRLDGLYAEAGGK
jgi:glyoxylase-like metal-dependent hydrolase (beta-lactamase superfamily II)